MIRVFLSSILTICLFSSYSYAAPCNSPKLPKKGELFGGIQTYVILKRYLENERGEVRSFQNFFKLSYGVYDWLSIDLAGGVGNIKQHPVGSDEVDYFSSFAGGYGFRIKFYDRKKMRIIYGFHHISVHPRSTRLENVKNRAILDDWQVSLSASYDFPKCSPYLGLKWSRVDYIHWVEEDRKRNMSDLTKVLGLIRGFDIPLTRRVWLNIEGQFFDTEALA